MKDGLTPNELKPFVHSWFFMMLKHFVKTDHNCWGGGGGASNCKEAGTPTEFGLFYLGDSNREIDWFAVQMEQAGQI